MWEATFAIPSCRPEGLMRLLESIRSTRYAGWPIRICAQRFTQAQVDAVYRTGLDVLLVNHDALLGPFHARQAILKEWPGSPAWCNLDDDALLTERTAYEKPLAWLASRRAIGLVSCGWARTQAEAWRRVTEDRWVAQPIVYTGGGLLYREDVAEIIRAMPCQPYLFDNVEWSLASYLAGHTNYRFLGSVAIAKVCTADGRREWVRMGPRVLPDKRWVRNRRTLTDHGEGAGNGWHITGSGDLKAAAREAHLAARSSRGLA